MNDFDGTKNVYCVCHNMASYAFLNYFRFRKTDDGYTDNPRIMRFPIFIKHRKAKSMLSLTKA